MKLPRSLDELEGRRAARWVRESTRNQYDTFGPEAQREQQDRAIARHGLVDTGLSWTVAHSGRTVGSTSQFTDMLAAAGRDYDVLVVGYVSRFARDLRTAVNARHDLHSAGAAILFCDERVLSSDEEAWETWAREAVEAEAYSRRLGKRIREGYAAKFRRLADQGGNAPLGFRRTGQQSTLAIAHDTIASAVALFERYGTGSVSLDDLADETGHRSDMLRELLRNPIYNGWVTRRGERAAAPWRVNPPVSDVLWEQVEGVRHRHTHGGGPRVAGRIDLVRGLVRCACGSRVKANGTKRGQQRRYHVAPVPCPAGTEHAVLASSRIEDTIEAQVSGIRLNAKTTTDIVRVLSSPTTAPQSIDRARSERRRRELAIDFAQGRLSLADFQAALDSIDAIEPTEEAIVAVSADRAVHWLRNLAALWSKGSREERAELVASIYDSVTVVGPNVVGVRLTPVALSHGLALAMPERVVLARPEGFEPATL